MNITCKIDDGYAGGSRPHHVKINDDDLAECADDEARIKLIDEAVQDHFLENISPYWDHKQLSRP